MQEKRSAPIFAGSLRGIGKSFAALTGVTAIADFLFYDSRIGISAAVFILVLAGATALTNSHRPPLKNTFFAGCILTVSLLPIIENFGVLSLLSGLAGISTFSLLVSGAFSGSLFDRISEIIWVLLSGPYQLDFTLKRALRALKRGNSSSARCSHFLVWFVPLAMSGVFLLLFRSANPLVEDWLAKLNLAGALQAADFARALFWIATAAITWSFVRVRVPRHPWWWERAWGKLTTPIWRQGSWISTEVPWSTPEQTTVDDLLFGARATVRSLVLFNVLFAVQTALDVAYLWGGLALPEGLTYAAYAHRGAYPLVFTALLSATFILLAMRPGSETENSPLIRGLVFLWTGQNLILLMSAVLRLDLYVEAYSMTYWRVAAFIWMCLVGIGLLLIVWRIAMRHSNEWLVTANLFSLAAAIYICGFINFASFVANFNVNHSHPVLENGNRLDVIYLCKLGAHAIPAIDRFIEHSEDENDSGALTLRYCKNIHISDHVERHQDWRNWSFRAWRLSRYLNRRVDG